MTLAECKKKIREQLPDEKSRVAEVSEEWIHGQAVEMMRIQEAERKKKEARLESARRRKAQEANAAAGVRGMAQGELPEAED